MRIPELNIPFLEAVGRIPYQYRHPRLLHGLIRWLEPDVVVEVGTHIGFAACWMARALKENGHGQLFCVDNFCWPESQKELWEANLGACGVREWAILIEGRSQEVEWPASVDFAFIDGNHTYPICRHDATRARELGARCIALHDTVSWEGSRRYAEEMRESADWGGWDFLESETECGLLVAKRRMPKGPCEGEDIGEKWDVPNAAA